MNDAHRYLLAEQFNKAVEEYVRAFCVKHRWPFVFDWVGGKVGETLVIEDCFVDFSDIKTDIDNNFPEEMFGKWYDYSLRLHELGCEKNINYYSYAKGAPRPYSEAHLRAIEVAKKRRDEAEEDLRDCLAAQTDEMDFINKEGEE